MATIEVCIDCLHAAAAALRGGAQRLETCASLAEGGLTPSIGFVRGVDALIRKLNPSSVQYVMVRPRGGDFVYSAEEQAAMEADIAAVKGLRLRSVAGFVLGFLTQDRVVDAAATARFVAACRPLKVTFHRAVDVAADYLPAVESVLSAGCDYLLTSGGCARAIDGRSNIAAAVKLCCRRMCVMAGSGVSPDNALELMAAGVDHLHFSAKTRVPAAYESIPMGSSDSGDGYNSASEDTVRRMLSVVGQRSRI
ncbi:Copper homeostasis protein CutC [Diplonema papillatum]|nr:Copper homeostasis protein CutC [Diplonema papillatum]